MEQEKGIEKIGYCGLVCGICSHAAGACQGCRDGGGDAGCIQRKCCLVKGLAGCWECDEFPCGKGFFGDDAWKGLCVGFCRAIREVGAGECADRARTVLGSPVDYGNYRHRTPGEIQALLQRESGR